MGLNKQERLAAKEIRLQKKREKRRTENYRFEELVRNGQYDEIETIEKFRSRNHGSRDV